MPPKVWTAFDFRLSYIFTFFSEPHEANKFPLLEHASIQYVWPKTHVNLKPSKKKSKIISFKT